MCTVDLEEFVEEVKKRLEERVTERGENYKVSIVTIPASNGVFRVAIQIVKMDKIGFLTYMEPFYRRFLKDTDMTEEVIADMILAKTRQIGVGNSLETQLFMEAIKNFEVVKERLYCQIVNTERNKAFLDEAVHKEILDLSLVLRVMVCRDANGIISFKVPEKIIDMWNIDKKTFWKKVIRNTREMFPPEFLSMNELVTKELGEKAAEQLLSQDIDLVPMHILSNEAGKNGAVYLADKQELDKVAKTLNDDFYIFPASVDMLILLTKSDVERRGMSLLEMKFMVWEGNQEQQDSESFLSSNVYYYSRTMGLSIAGGEKDVQL